MDAGISPHLLDQLAVHVSSGLSRLFLFGLISCQALLVLLLEDLGLLLTLLLFLLRILVSLLHLLVQGVNHALHLGIPLSFAPRRILFGCFVSFLLDLLNLRLELGLHLRISASNFGADDLAIPLDLVQSSLNSCPISGFSIVRSLLPSHRKGLVLLLASLLSALSIFNRFLHLILRFLALLRVLLGVSPPLSPLTFALVMQPLQHGILLTLLSLLLCLSSSAKRFQAQLVDGLRLIPQAISLSLLCLRKALILLHLVQHVLTLLLPRALFLILHLVKLLQLLVQHAPDF
mmetsp:Transcript_18705/g.44384  ORF Transcript_18705/g.44384 Transcript_18705/m.44384 type:complete len:290 (-) Transcript_18705:586-1455(-)